MVDASNVVIPGERSETRDPYRRRPHSTSRLNTCSRRIMGPGSAALRALAGMTVNRYASTIVIAGERSEILALNAAGSMTVDG